MSTPEKVSIASAVPMVDVVAPATLKEGYTFDAIYNGQTFTVHVPPGGVVKGQRFPVPFQNATSTVTSYMLNDGGNAGITPMGRWKTGLCWCFHYGLCHPSLINACFCPQILMAQVMTRLRLNWLGETAPDEERRKTFKIIFYMVAAFWTASFLIPSEEYTTDKHGHLKRYGPSPFFTNLKQCINFAFAVYTLYALTKTRRAAREQFEISEERCIGCEDLCCSFWCGCCTVSQLARQTADYDSERANYCTDTGLKPLNPVIIV